ncbi:MAG: SCO family protein [Pedosphaera sp.]|nr:SCO family protein [Pedosphaera sp.]
MRESSRILTWIVWGVLGLVVASILVAFIKERRTRSPENLPVLGRVTDFNLTNQLGNRVSLSNIVGRMTVANIIFTRCAGPCPKLMRQMRQVHDGLGATAPVAFLTLTADPVYDTPEVLRKYGLRFPSEAARWVYLTGAKPELYRLAIDDFKFTVLDNQQQRQPDEDLFVHSMKFVVVDSTGQIRAYVDGDEPETVERILGVVSALTAEMMR